MEMQLQDEEIESEYIKVENEYYNTLFAICIIKCIFTPKNFENTIFAIRSTISTIFAIIPSILTD